MEYESVEKTRELYWGKQCTINGRPALIASKGDAAMIFTSSDDEVEDEENKISVEVSWQYVFKIMNSGGNFKAKINGKN